MPLLEEEAPREPWPLFQRWYDEAKAAGSPQVSWRMSGSTSRAQRTSQLGYVNP